MICTNLPSIFNIFYPIPNEPVTLHHQNFKNSSILKLFHVKRLYLAYFITAWMDYKSAFPNLEVHVHRQISWISFLNM